MVARFPLLLGSVLFKGFPGSSVEKNLPANAEDARDVGSVPGLEMATHSIILAGKNPMDRGAWWATILGSQKSQTRLSD